MIKGSLRFRLSLYLVFLCVLLLCSTADSIVMKKLTLSQLVKQASVIAEGKVDSIRSMWNETHTMIITYIDITFEPESYLKGNPKENKITLKLWGGTVGDITTVVVGNPGFIKGEEVLLFVRPGRKGFKGFSRVAGRVQGKCRIDRKADPKKSTATRDLTGISLVGPAKPEGPDVVPLVELRAAIDEEVKRQKQQ